MTLPAPVSYVGGEMINWSRIVIGGGSHLLSGPALFQSYQGFYDPRVVWSRNWARLYTPGVLAQHTGRHLHELRAGEFAGRDADSSRRASSSPMRLPGQAITAARRGSSRG
jgi:hypothetical protein